MKHNLFDPDAPSGRKGKRYAISLPVVITSPTEAAAIEATVRDISSQGIYLYLPKDAQAGPKLDFSLVLPEELANRDGVQVKCKATVLRVDRNVNDELVGVAAKIRSFKFTGPKPDQS